MLVKGILLPGTTFLHPTLFFPIPGIRFVPAAAFLYHAHDMEKSLCFQSRMYLLFPENLFAMASACFAQLRRCVSETWAQDTA